MNQSDHLRLLCQLQAAYAATIGTNDRQRIPPKHAYTILRSGPLVTLFSNVMSAQLEDGTVTAKVSLRDEETGAARSVVVHCTPEGDFQLFDGAPIATYRCALMALLATERLFPLGSRLRLGLIGPGRLNHRTLTIFADLYQLEQIIVRGRPRTPPCWLPDWQQRWPQLIWDEGDPGRLSTCDVVISATNALHESPLTYYDLVGTRLYIAQDSGYVFGPTFREQLPSYCDDPLQLNAHWTDEFPHDRIHPPLQHLLELTHGPAVVYLYGMALGDAIITRALARQELSL